MKHRKFVKQLMSMGYQRNAANGLAMYARMGGWTYEQYLQIEKKRIAHERAMLNIQISPVDMFTPAVKAAQQAMERLREAFAGLEWKIPSLAPMFRSWAAEEDPLPMWPKENPHRCDVVDALRYATLLHPLPDNIQVMSAADHARLHGYTAHTVLVDELETAPGGGQK